MLFWIKLCFIVLLFSDEYNYVYAKDELHTVTDVLNAKQCEKEISTHCKSIKSKTNSNIINCLQSSKEIIKSLSTGCQHFLWDFKIQYLDVDFFNRITFDTCRYELEKCKNQDNQVICLIKRKSQITDFLCKSHINEIAKIVFSDILLIYKFISNCANTIKDLKCGRIEKDMDTYSSESFISRITSQGETIECLVKSLNRVNGECRKEILKLSELQSDDYHLNPNLFYACRHDRESLCGPIEAGNSRIYRCLEDQKLNPLMSMECQKALNIKHQLEGHDYKIRHHFSEKCAKDIYKHKCSTKDTSDNSSITDLYSVMVCLLRTENTNTLEKACRAEVLSTRKQMAQNMEMSPQLRHNCQQEIQKHCSKINSTTDSIVHCLMRNSMPALEQNFNSKCLKSLKNFIKIIDPAEYIEELDPVINEVCKKELSNLCNSTNYIQPNSRYQCLLSLIDDDKPVYEIEDNCKTNLLTLARFVELEYSMNHKLFKTCHEDAIKHCRATNTSFVDSSSLVPHAILHCLLRKWNQQYINIEKHIISYKCSMELKNVMKIEASNLKMNFKIYTTCTMDIAKNCMHVSHKMDCLQLNYRKLSKPCKSSISDFLSLDTEDFTLKKLIARSCSPMIRIFCSDKVSKNKDYMQCLINQKYNKTMDPKCRITLEHYQIIALEDYKIDHKFARFCSKEIQKFCKNLLPKSKNEKDEDLIYNDVTKSSQVTKSQIVSCLSEKLTKSLLKKDSNPFSAQCYEQFTFEFLQQTNSINFDPEIRKICEIDINQFCSTVETDSILTCLHGFQDSLSEHCVNLLISRQQLGALDTKFDAGIQRYCREMITNYCKNINSHRIFRCLHKNMRIEGFNPECKERIRRRLERRLVDLRLNPELIDNCRNEIRVNCNLTKIEVRISDMKVDDKYHIINCLRYVYVEHQKFLNGPCRRLVYDIVLDANSDFHLDPGLNDVCKTEIKDMCSESLVENNVEASGKVQDCLKHRLLLKQITNEKCNKEVYRLLREGLADVHVDPQLYSSCRDEIYRICHTERLGHGRKLSCLLWALENKLTTSHISTGCKSILLERKEMWEFATRMEAPKNVREVMILISDSESKHYFVMGFVCIVLAILLIGIACGRHMNRTKKTIRKRR